MRRLLSIAAPLLVAGAGVDFVSDPELAAAGGGTSMSPAGFNRATIAQTAQGVASSPGHIHLAGFEALLGSGGATTLASESFDAGIGAFSVVSGAWSAAAGVLAHAAGGAGRESIRSDGPSTAHAAMEVEVTVPSGTPLVSLVFRAESPTLDGNNQYWATLDYAAGQLRLRRDLAGVESELASAALPLSAGTSVRLKVKFADDELRVLVDGLQRICLSDASLQGSGAYGLQVENGAADFDDWLVLLATNSTPVANAGADQAISAGTALLNGTASADEDGDPLNFAWTQLSGPAVSLSNPSSAAPTFSAAAGQTYVFQLSVNDCLNAAAPDSVTVSVAGSGGGGGGGGGGCGLTGLEPLLLLLLLRRR